MIPNEKLYAIAESDDFITHDGIMRDVSPLEGVAYSKRDLLFRSGIWRNGTQESAVKKIRQSRSRVIVIGHSDTSFSRGNWAILHAAGARRVFAANCTFVSDAVTPMPLGLTNFTHETDLHPLFGDRDPLRRVILNSRRTETFSGSIYCNFSLATHPERRQLLRQVAQLRNVTVDDPSYTQAGREKYLRALQEANFVLCPRGNGLDTHRLWETLYAGGVPIVKRYNLYQALLTDLPVVFVDHWSQVKDLEWLEEQWFQIAAAHHDGRELSQTHWKERVASAAQGLVSGH